MRVFEKIAAPGFSDPLVGDPALLDKWRALKSRLDGLEKTVIGFSGGVDSTLLAAAARSALGRDRAIACLALGPSLPEKEKRDAEALADLIDIELVRFQGTEFDNPAYVANGADRCFHCKTDLFVHLKRIAGIRGISPVLYGANADDGMDYRPGHRAAREHGALAPLAEAGLTKADVRVLSRAFGLPTADKPAMPCLSSRIPYGSPVDRRKLAAIEAGEALLADMGFRESRVRHYGDFARVEVPLDQVRLLEDAQRRLRLTTALKSQGIERVVVDPNGLRSGNLNDALPEATRRIFSAGG